MKKLILIILIFLAGFKSFAQTDTIYHFSNDTSLFIFDKFTYNCSAGFIVNMYTANNTISIYAVDTNSLIALCYCNFEILTEIDNLEIQTYLINYYRVDKWDDTNLVYSFYYTNENIQSGNIPESNYISGLCGESIWSRINLSAKPEDVRLYPNPAENQLWISAIGNRNFQEITLLNVTGQEIIKLYPASNSCTLDVSLLDPGIYFVRIKSGNTFQTKKVVKW